MSGLALPNAAPIVVDGSHQGHARKGCGGDQLRKRAERMKGKQTASGSGILLRHGLFNQPKIGGASSERTLKASGLWRASLVPCSFSPFIL
jgi:hypothetical protein